MMTLVMNGFRVSRMMGVGHVATRAGRCSLLGFLAVFSVLLTSAPGAHAKLSVVTTIAHIAEPISVIAGDRATVMPLMGPGVDPHLYRPTRSDILALTRADVILWSGLSLEAQMEDAMARLSKTKPVVAISEALRRDRLLPWEGKAGDPHVWMDPGLWRVALASAVDALVSADPDGAEEYRARAESYFDQMTTFEAYAEQASASVPERARVLVTAHDAFGYFGARYGLEVMGIQGISTESEAGLAMIESLVDTLVERKISAVFVETSVSDRHVQALIEGAAARGHAVVIGGSLYSDAMGEPGTYEGTYLGMLDHNVTVIARALGGSAPARGWMGELAYAR